MSAKPKPSPGPWYQGKRPTEIFAPDPTGIDYPEVLVARVFYETDALLIVRAVNAHDGLVDVLGRLVARITGEARDAGKFLDILKEAEAVIAKAKGGA